MTTMLSVGLITATSYSSYMAETLRVTANHRSFSRIGQMAPMYGTLSCRA